MLKPTPNYLSAVWISLFLSIAFAVYEKNWLAVLVSSLTTFSVFYIIRLNSRINFRLPSSIIVLAIFFIYASLFLGEAFKFYEKFWWWDIILHASSALGFGLIGMIILIALFRGDKLKASPVVISMFAFAFAVAIGALWEIFEFTMDQTFGLNMQKSGLRDTMTDLIVDMIGALISCTAGFFYLKFVKHDVLLKKLNEFFADESY